MEPRRGNVGLRKTVIYIVLIDMKLIPGLLQPRMTYASSKESLKNALNGIAAEVQANRDDEIEYATILKDISKGKR